MNAVVAFALKQRALIVALFLLIVGAGLVSFTRLNIEAYPDPVPPLVEIITQASGQAAEEIERYFTIPIEIQMEAIPNVTSIRSISLFGLSDVRISFGYNFTYDEAQQRVINRLSQLSPLPNSVVPQISPSSPTGEIYRYRVVGPPGYSVTDLKTIQDWILQRRFKAIPGVIDVSGWAGKSKTYEVTVDLDKLVEYGLTLPQTLQVINNSNVNVGGQTINFGPQAAIVRGVGLIHTLDDLRDTMLTSVSGAPVYVKDVATVKIGNQPRLGIVGQDNDDDIVQGIVLMRRGEQSLPTIRRVEAEVEKINSTGVMPPGVQLVKIYDRRDLINTTTNTVLHNMIFGIVLIFLVQWLFLGSLRSAIVVAATIPFALLFAISILVLLGESANLLSVGAIDFGLVVDATVIMVENIFRHLSEGEAVQDYAPVGIARAAGLTGRLRTILRAAAEVNLAIFFAAAIIIAGFVPLFTLSGVEGHIFGPMAKTYAYAIVGGLIATFTVSPVLASLLLPNRTSETEPLFVACLRRVYRPVLHFAIGNRILVLGGMGLIVGLAILAVRSLGLEFLPHLEEGNLWIRATLPPTISLEEAEPYVSRIRHVIGDFPEAVTVISQLGRPDDGTDTTGFFNAEFSVPLKPFDTWPSGVDKERLTEQMNAALIAQFPGVDFNFSQYIEDNVEEAASGIKGENAIKLFGNDLGAIQQTAYEIKDVLRTVPGIADLSVFESVGQPTIDIDIDRLRAARYGLAPGDINTTIQAAIGGTAAGNVYEYGSDRNFPIIVRLAPKYRQSLDAIRHITVGAQSPSGSGVVPIPLADLADIKLVSGPSFIYRENQQRFIPIKFSVRGRDLGGAVLEAQQKIGKLIKLPPGSRLEWAGEFGQLEQALGRLDIVVPLSIVLIYLLLFLNFGSLVDMVLAASVMPIALIGGIFALLVTRTPFSVSAAIGFVALFGIAAMDGVIVIAYYNRLIDAGVERAAALLRTCDVQMRPVVMTCVVACVGLLPAAVSSGIGSQVQKPLALVVVGGILLAPVLILIMLPVLIALFSRRTRPAVVGGDGTPDTESSS
jgi:cobalt-zinc-cadmium resistance protein CzcA